MKSHILVLLTLADISMEEGEYNLPLLPPTKTRASLLLIHSLLRHPPTNHVHTGSRASLLGYLLRPHFHVDPQHTTSTKIVPVSSPIPSLREHNVGHEIQRNDLGPIPARQRLRMGCDKENRQSIGVGPAELRREGIENSERRKDPTKAIRVRARNAGKVKRDKRAYIEDEEEEQDLQE